MSKKIEKKVKESKPKPIQKGTGIHLDSNPFSFLLKSFKFS